MKRNLVKLNTSTGDYLVGTSAIIWIKASSDYLKLFFNDGKMLVTAKRL
ncbi:MAG: hypothetical protein ABJA37_08465 [Ferruginibacter sp.]